ncbi:MAG TPA: histidine phosphatase family protein [Bacteroidia bacterium]|jgi:phosphohistidine phosphatase|nr:histidine phosphatase family protein [Bacteroidia bacterium]
MKKLLLIRHAKSAWGIASLPDIDRPLNHRGYSDAYEMSERLIKVVKGPHIITSPAIRAVSTALIFSRTFGVEPQKIWMEKRLYESAPEEYLDVIRTIDDKHHEVLLFGHNPVITEVLDMLASSGTEEMSTCAVAGIEFNVKSWKEIAPEHAKLFLFDFPKNKE